MKIRCSYSRIVKIQDLNLNPENRNVHPEDQIKRLAEILKYQGWRYCVKVSNQTGMVTSGHGRVEAALLNGWSEVPVDDQDYDTPEQEYADTIADNAIASWAELNLSGINTDIQLYGPELNIEMLGMRDFTVEPADKLEPQCDEDAVPEYVEPKTKLGDIYQLGRHRLMCGDSTSIDAVEKLMNGEKADMCFTSPPYNGDTHLDYGDGNNQKLYENDFDAKSSEDYIDFCHQVLNNIFLVTDGFVFWNVNYNAKSRFEYIKSIYPFVDKLWETIIWKKTGMPIPSGLTRNCEFIFCFKSNSKKKHIWNDFETEFNLWDISNLGSQHENHKACFPVELPQKGIEISTNKDAIVYEPFGGSGSTLIACEKTNRNCFMMELDPHYCDVIVARWEKYTGKKAERISDG